MVRFSGRMRGSSSLRQAADPAGRVEDHREVENDDADGRTGQRTAQGPHDARVAACAHEVARPVGGSRAAEGVGGAHSCSVPKLLVVAMPLMVAAG